MIKTAFFVEGQTERIFLEKFLSEYLGWQNIRIESQKRISDDIHKTVGDYKGDPAASFYFLIFDAGGDEKALSEMLERADNMIGNQGFSWLIVIRDLHPSRYEDKHRVLRSVLNRINRESHSDKLKIVLSVMGVETWFLGELNFLQKIDQRLTADYIRENTRYDLEKDDLEKDQKYGNPASVLKTIMEQSGSSYDKKIGEVTKIVNNMDFNSMTEDEYITKIKSFNYLLRHLNEATTVN